MTGKVKLVIIATIFAVQVLMLGMVFSPAQAQGTNWAILISGGWNWANNHARYWNDLSEMNEILTDIYGYDPANIFVLYADGNPPSVANCHDWGDADASYPTNIIDNSATRANIQAVCNHISMNGDPDDTLFVFSTDHGDTDLGGALLLLWGETVSANNFAADIGAITQYSWRAFEMEQCYSGGFVGPLSGPRTVIATACASNELSYAFWPPPPFYDVFCYHFNAALKGELPDGTVVNADEDGDGRISFMEAFNYAETNDTATETPQYDDNGDGTSHTGQMPFSGDGCLGSMVFLGEPHTAIDHGLVWLCNDQNPNGSWSNSVGMTSLGSLVFLNSGISEDHFAIEDAIGYIASYVQTDGSINNGYPTYDTSLSIMALVATHNPSYTVTINNATNWLKDSQWDESCLWGNVSMDNWQYGGFGYGFHTRPDLSNTQFALMALDSVTSISKSDLLWDKAQIFLARDQMRQEDVFISDLGYTVTWNPIYNIYNDGGFVYYPGVSLSYTGTSYGSMTAAGIWGLRLCDVPSDDPRTVTALNWLLSNYTWDYNPGMMPDGRRFQYYYYLGMSKALTMTLPTEFFDGHDWYADMSAKLSTLQNPDDGYWVNTYTGHGSEGDPALCTSYSILSLQVREIPAPISRLSWLTFILNSYADLHVYDPEGRHVGMNYDTGEIEIQIPGASFTNVNGTQIIEIPSWIMAGKYVTQMIGTGTGKYELTIQGGYQGDVLVNETISGFIVKDALHEVVTTAAMVVGLDMEVAVFDEDPPVIEIEVPQPNQALQDGVTLSAAASDQSGVESLDFYLREPGGIPIGLEELQATFNGATSRWEYQFDTTQLLDGYYEILAKAVDGKGYEGWSEVVTFSIRNWAVVELLPASQTNKAGRTMPVKFSLRIAEAVDPDTPFVYNEQMEIRIYDAADPGNILQQSTFGSTSTDYRINAVTELYITNFRTEKTPAQYVVEIWRTAKNFMIGSFTFETVK